MRKIIIITFINVISVIFFGFPKEIQAHCPLCVAGAAAGITLTRWVGVDDSITGIWIGAFLGAATFWLLRSLGQRNKVFFNRFIGATVYILIFIITLWSFYKFKLIIRMDSILGFDKLTFGMILGSAVFYLVDLINIVLKRKNGKSLFPYQSMVFSLSSIIITSVGVYVLINYFI
ncbi:hypothetical protein A2865_01395 [Candidatus Woesebacteria bacterium RIFCSPHIGHO2_01_FULL_39_17]|uniref:Uncharacterized protein n=3 Tax=Candidatus Woeseibacteriota TaxID=1752722 RepID=A0A0G0NEG8_9BACT|nr:MAG: hypothetical protein US72_C0003G0071 [Microgenomates group bacterium GW2011_GWC1_38_12]KKQ94496.1 MAG: hypothetical protein UT19_C0001G0028 [Candidatus Woesebacteria bacterium GW2011_GWB1_39_10b]KKR13893.1 MAG: hypothetical protein UT40_C0008G0017 [Candidatus Woesebacteria bacterium GW2011_GWA1_39_21b]OGM23052.1 MAG: hypothetical protein A2865_01395 [Candidatus Woesebacteria bacterium RIFCSPHIGHO2_01_FULL_39_17]OGM65563.1 MAG: hypothetical protein A3A52_01645 [Candidatus Woesebacteria b